MSTPSKELLERVIEVTGSSEAEAQHFLSACANDVEAAVALYYEQGGDSFADAIAETASSNNEDEVRAPIAPVREQLLRPEDDNFFSTSAPPARLARVSQRVKVCPLRDFAREGALMEEQLQAASAGIPSSGSAGHPENAVGSSNNHITSRQARSAGLLAMAHGAKPSGASRLGDLFRPPTDLAYVGSFQSVRARASDVKRWLLVNVQSDNFASQLLNRDVWSDREMRKLIRRQFMLWQIESDSNEGRRFVAFYHCPKQPYVCVIDPRTGEEVWKNADPKQATLLLELKEFLREHKDFIQEMEENAPSTSKRTTDQAIDENEASTSTANGAKRNKLIELTEEAQIALAIRNSMHENSGKPKAASLRAMFQVNNDSSDSSSVEEFGEDDLKSACERISYEEQLGGSTEELTTLKLRMPTDEIVQLRWPSDTQLQVLRMYIAQKHVDIPKTGYKLICAFPRQTLEAEHDACTMKDLGLHPSANLHLTLEE